MLSRGLGGVVLMRRLFWRVAAVLLLAGLVGCSSYAMQGRVVRGDSSSVEVVSKDDPRLDAPPLGRATLEAVLDPRHLNRRRLPVVTSDDTGRFAVPIDATGAGFLDYDVRVLARREDHTPAEAIVPLPGSNKRVLVTLAPGEDASGGLGEDPLEESLRYHERLYGD